METPHTIQFTALPKPNGMDTNFDFWAAYWHITPEELHDIIAIVGSSSYLKIDSYLKERKASA